MPNTEPDREGRRAPRAEAARGSARRAPRGHSVGNPSPLRAGRTRPGLWPLRSGPGCRRCSAATAAPGTRSAARTAGPSVLPAPGAIMEEPPSGPDRARGSSRGSGQDSGPGLAAARLLPRRLLSAATLPPPPPRARPRPSSRRRPSAFRAPRPSLKGTAGRWLRRPRRRQAPAGRPEPVAQALLPSANRGAGSPPAGAASGPATYE